MLEKIWKPDTYLWVSCLSLDHICTITFQSQWSWLLPPLHNTAKQAAEDIREWRYHLLHQVRQLPVDSLNYFTSFDFYFKLDHFLVLTRKNDLHRHKSWISLNCEMLKYYHYWKILMESLQPIPSLIFKFFTSLISCLNSSSRQLYKVKIKFYL